VPRRAQHGSHKAAEVSSRASARTFGDGQRRAPLPVEDVQADASIQVDVGMEHTREKVHLGRLEGVVGREPDVEKEDAAGVRALRRARDCHLPVEDVITDCARAAARWRVLTEVV